MPIVVGTPDKMRSFLPAVEQSPPTAMALAPLQAGLAPMQVKPSGGGVNMPNPNDAMVLFMSGSQSAWTALQSMLEEGVADEFIRPRRSRAA